MPVVNSQSRSSSLSLPLILLSSEKAFAPGKRPADGPSRVCNSCFTSRQAPTMGKKPVIVSLKASAGALVTRLASGSSSPVAALINGVSALTEPQRPPPPPPTPEELAAMAAAEEERAAREKQRQAELAAERAAEEAKYAAERAAADAKAKAERKALEDRLKEKWVIPYAAGGTIFCDKEVLSSLFLPLPPSSFLLLFLLPTPPRSGSTPEKTPGSALRARTFPTPSRACS